MEDSDKGKLLSAATAGVTFNEAAALLRLSRDELWSAFAGDDELRRSFLQARSAKITSVMQAVAGGNGQNIELKWIEFVHRDPDFELLARGGDAIDPAKQPLVDPKMMAAAAKAYRDSTP